MQEWKQSGLCFRLRWVKWTIHLLKKKTKTGYMNKNFMELGKWGNEYSIWNQIPDFKRPFFQMKFFTAWFMCPTNNQHHLPQLRLLDHTLYYPREIPEHSTGRQLLTRGLAVRMPSNPEEQVTQTSSNCSWVKNNNFILWSVLPSVWHTDVTIGWSTPIF